MANKNIRTRAIHWFKSNLPGVKEPVYSSKFYTSAESWSKSPVWFFQIPMRAIEPGKNRFIHLLCENQLKGKLFIYLKIPVSFLSNNLTAFDIDEGKKVIRIYLSAEAGRMFREVRKKDSNIRFLEFVQNI